MSKQDNIYKIHLHPIGATVEAAAGTPLRDLLFEQGVEFPCGGNGRCRGCKVRVRAGRADVNAAQRNQLRESEIADGWRLACQCRVEDDLTVELRQWDATILANDTEFAFTPQEGLGVAIDIGTTTLAAQLLDRETGHVLAVKTALNPQARHGGDVMSRVEFAVAGDGRKTLEEAIRGEVARLVRLLLKSANADGDRLRRVALVGNTVMHHLFCSIDLEPLSHYPFEPVDDGVQVFTAEQLGWFDIHPACEVVFLPCLGGFVGSDILAGLLATGLPESEKPTLLLDLGTNGEIVLGTRERMLCASTAAGPAFEGARIAQGMRAATGAIWKVAPQDGELHCEVLGNVPARGICGSGLVDAVAAALELRRIKPNGRLAEGKMLPLAGDVALTQTDIRQLQLAKGAIAAGVRLLLGQWGIEPKDVDRVYLAGAFGNYVNRASARRIGLLEFGEEQIQPVGNTALLGAKIALFAADGAAGYADLRARTRHVGLNEDPSFQETYVEMMGFPAG